MTDILAKLRSLADPAYAAFQSRLIPTLDKELFIGVRVPELRKLARTYAKDPAHEDFLTRLPHRYYDENMLHGLLISDLADYEQALAYTQRFLPYVDNWAVCDIMSPRSFRKHRPQLIEEIKLWAASTHTYTCRFGLEMLMSHFLTDDFQPVFLEIPAAVKSGEYYVNMMLAWFFAEALAKQWESALPYLQSRRLSPWVQNKTIQKARESLRISSERKELLQGLKISDKR